MTIILHTLLELGQDDSHQEEIFILTTLSLQRVWTDGQRRGRLRHLWQRLRGGRRGQGGLLRHRGRPPGDLALLNVLFHHYIITGADQPAGGLQRGADQPGVLRHGRHQHRGQLRPRHQPHRNLLRHYTTSNLYLETFIHYLYLETWLPLTLTCTTTEDLTKS